MVGNLLTKFSGFPRRPGGWDMGAQELDHLLRHAGMVEEIDMHSAGHDHHVLRARCGFEQRFRKTQRDGPVMRAMEDQKGR